jgi:hypothetical protein
MHCFLTLNKTCFVFYYENQPCIVFQHQKFNYALFLTPKFILIQFYFSKPLPFLASNPRFYSFPFSRLFFDPKHRIFIFYRIQNSLNSISSNNKFFLRIRQSRSLQKTLTQFAETAQAFHCARLRSFLSFYRFLF